MRLALLLMTLLGVDGATGRVAVVQRPLESRVSIPAGTFSMGAREEAMRAAWELCKADLGEHQIGSCSREWFLGEGTARTVWLSGYAIDRVEVTVASWRACVQAGACSPQPLSVPDVRFLRDELPITSVTWAEAGAFCRFRGGRLPSEAEWERAARGRTERTWPWGNVPKKSASNHGLMTIPCENCFPVLAPDPSDGFAFLAPVGSFPDGATPDGVLDLAGNASEWTSDAYDEDPRARRLVNPRAPIVSGAARVVRGGSWRQPRVFQRTTWRDGLPADTRSPEVGFRCAY